MKNYQAKTLEEIIEQAAEDYGCDTSSLTYNALEQKDGILGIGKSITAEVFTMDDVKEFLFDYMGDFFTGIDLDLECAIEEKDNAFIVNLNADNNAVLIGKMGKTLSAFNTVIKAAVNAKFKKRIDILIDVNHYKSDRYYKLRGMAMPNDERKVIHKALNEWHNIKTESEGEGSNRHVCISYVEDSAE